MGARGSTCLIPVMWAGIIATQMQAERYKVFRLRLCVESDTCGVKGGWNSQYGTDSLKKI